MGQIADLNDLATPVLADYLLVRDVSDLTDRDKKLLIGTLRSLLLANGTLTNPMLADMAQATLKGRASGAGTGAPADLTAAQVNTIIEEAAPFTPIVSDSDIGGATATPATAAGYYVKRGVDITAFITILGVNTTGLSAAAPLWIRNLPYPSLNSANFRATCTPIFGNVTFTANPVGMMLGNSSAIRFFRMVSAAAVGVITVANFANGTSDVIFTLPYRTN